MEAPRADGKTDAVQTPILDYRNCGGNICCWFGKLRSILFQSRSAHSDSRELMSSLWLGLSHVAGNPRVDSETFPFVLRLNLDESHRSYLECMLSIQTDRPLFACAWRLGSRP